MFENMILRTKGRTEAAKGEMVDHVDAIHQFAALCQDSETLYIAFLKTLGLMWH
jgi:hypothetical protein